MQPVKHGGCVFFYVITSTVQQVPAASEEHSASLSQELDSANSGPNRIVDAVIIFCPSVGCPGGICGVRHLPPAQSGAPAVSSPPEKKYHGHCYPAPGLDQITAVHCMRNHICKLLRMIQLARNAIAGSLVGTSSSELHWLPISSRAQFKVLAFNLESHFGLWTWISEELVAAL